MLCVDGTIRKTRFGINFVNVFCPVCRIAVSTLFSKPRTFREWIWGGATCNNCDCRMDKWGDPVMRRMPQYKEDFE